MQKTELNKSLKEFSFEIHYLNSLNHIEHIGNENYEDIIYVRCYPKWDMDEQELKKSIENNKVMLFKKIEKITSEHDLFYCYFNIDFSTIKGIKTKIVDNRVYWIEARPSIMKKNIDDCPKGFNEAGELPPEN